jgi:hypothetical protein
MAVPVRFVDQTAEIGTPVPLFVTNFGQGLLQERTQYVVAPDGQRFLMNTVANDATSPITVILNWQTGLRAGEKRQ